MTRPDEIPGNQSIEVEPDHDLPHGRDIPADMPDGGSVRGSGGWCAPSGVFELPEVTVPRGGIQWGERDPDDEFADDEGSAPEPEKYETEKEAVARQRWMTVRLALILLFVFACILTVRDALPWQ